MVNAMIKVLNDDGKNLLFEAANVANVQVCIFRLSFRLEG
jgi:hypothetical protein